jgi:exo-1,4-beta-D-glucosaminidase
MRGVVPPAEVGPLPGPGNRAPEPDTAAVSGLWLPGERLALALGWDLQSSAAVRATGQVLSSPTFRPAGWYPASVPTTVFGALVAQGVYPDPFFATNLRDVPGMGYPVAANFANLAMPPDSPFAVPWWYRKEFALPEAKTGSERIWLHLDGINYRAAVWLNGTQVAGPDHLAGALRTFTLDVTARARPGRSNVLAIEVQAPGENDLGITFVDWNPMPPDKNMGLWRDVYLTASGPAVVRHPAAVTRLEEGEAAAARVTLTALLENASDAAVTGTLAARLRPLSAPGEAIDLAQPIALGPGEQREVAFTSDAFPALRLREPRLWWPAQMGTPELADLTMELQVQGATSDRAAARVGLREITSELTADGHRVFRINGKRLLVRGAGWAPDLMLRANPARTADELAYVRDIGLNTVRLEGKMEGEEFFALTDRLGLLVMAGWCCCDHWERWPRWTPEDHKIAEASQRTQLYRLRGHPSLLAWLNGSDQAPPPPVETRYLAIARECRWPNPVLSSGTARGTVVSGETGLKMTGPYDYVAPSYWLTDESRGGAHGFNTETGPGPAIPPLESLRRMLPEDHLWPIDDHWRFHAGGGPFQDLGLFTEALAARYGSPRDLDDFLLKADVMAYEGIRALFEAFSRNKYRATGVIQWMLNNAWPSVIWHLYDYFLRPAGGYFGAKKACAPIHPLYGYDDGAIWLVNSRYQAVPGLTVTATVHDLRGIERGTRSGRVDAAADSAQRVFALPPMAGAPEPVSLLRLAVTDPEGRTVGSNFYWLSRAPETLDWDRSTWYSTPTAAFADFSALQALPPAQVSLTARSERSGEETVTSVSVVNEGPGPAFFVRLRLTRGSGGEEVLPVRWEDNYLSLLPRETRTIVARYRTRDLGGAEPAVRVGGWNLPR